jgi:glycosyltransferase involved in cell wall biosynthesis
VRTIVLVGELKPYKGLDVLIEAVGLLGTSSNQTFIIAGRPRMDLDVLRRRADSLGVGDRFEWFPTRLDDERLAEVLTRADAFVLPYHHADASGVLSLVLALGRPVVASRVGAMADLLDDGVHALVVPPSDAQALAGALSRLSNDGVAAKLAAGSTSALARLGDWETAADRHLELYHRLVGGSGR